jgi:hypothetical protein
MMISQAYSNRLPPQHLAFVQIDRVVRPVEDDEHRKPNSRFSSRDRNREQGEDLARRMNATKFITAAFRIISTDISTTMAFFLLRMP